MTYSIAFLNSVYAKTALGEDAIKTRSVRISQSLRRMLILIDGQKNVAGLMRLLGDSSVKDEIAELQQLGLISSYTIAIKPPQIETEKTLLPPIEEAQLIKIRNIITNISFDYLGVFSKPLVMDIQRANDRKSVGIVMARWKMALLESKCPSEIRVKSLDDVQQLLNV